MAWGLDYFDDGFVCDTFKQKILDMTLEIKQDLILSDFVPKVEKCLCLLCSLYSFLVL